MTLRQTAKPVLNGHVVKQNARPNWRGFRKRFHPPVIAGIRPAPLKTEDIARALGSDGQCRFIRAVNADPVLVTDGTGNGVAKLSGSLVNFTAQGTVTSGGVLSADGGQFTLTPGDGADGEDATLLFELMGETPLAVGFTGYWTCNG